MSPPPASYSRPIKSLHLKILLISALSVTSFIEASSPKQLSCSFASRTNFDNNSATQSHYQHNLNNNNFLEEGETETNVQESHRRGREDSSAEAMVGDLVNSNFELPYKWRYRYLEEQNGNFDVQLIEESLDERISNIIYTTHTIRLINIESFTFNLDNPNEQHKLEQLAAGPRVDNQQCGSDLEEMLQLYEELQTIVRGRRQRASTAAIGGAEMSLEAKHVKLAQMLDSYAHYESGLFLGRSLFVGAYSQCINTNLLLKNNRHLKSRYCSANLNIRRHLNPSLRARPKQAHEPSSTIAIGICLPETCHSISFHQHKHLIQKLINTQFSLPEAAFVDQNMEVVSMFCELDDDSYLGQIPLSGYMFLSFMALWLVLIVFVTIYRSDLLSQFKSNKWLKHAIKSFDLRRSWDSFVGFDVDVNHQQETKSRILLDALNPIKAFSSAFVILGHTLMMITSVSQDIIYSYQNAENDPVIAVVLSGTLVVDSFYVITGLLITFLAMRKFNNHRRSVVQFVKHSFQIIATRYLRLVPLYALVFWFHKSVFINLARGPHSDPGYNKYTEIGACRQESWITPFTFLAAYQPLARQCLPHTWSVASDMFFVMILAPIIITMLRRPKLAASITVSICCLSTYAMYSSISTMQGPLREGLSELRYHSFVIVFANASQLYTAPHFRIFSTFIGALAGYALYHYNEAETKLKWPKWFTNEATKFSFVYIIIMLFLPPLVVLLKNNLLQIVPLHTILFDASMTIGRLLWALSNAILFTRMTTDWQHTYVIKNFSTQFWRSLARLCYSMLLIHLDVIMFDMQAQMTNQLYTKYKIFSIATYTYLFCCILSIFVHVIVEDPIDKLIKGFLKGINDDSPKMVTIKRRLATTTTENATKTEERGSGKEVVDSQQNGYCTRC